MKITFEGKTFDDIIAQMEDVLEVADARGTGAITEPRNKPEPEMLRPERNKPEPEMLRPAPVENKRVRTEKQLANDEKLRERAQAKKAAGLKPFDKNPAPPKAVEKPVEKIVSYDTKTEEPKAEPEMFADPAEAVKIRQKTITDLQEAYANGHQQEVFELLSRFGNGAKSFRELPPEAFKPIREAIDKGALT